MDGREAELWGHSLLVVLAFVHKLHVEDGTGDADHELWHFEHMFSWIVWSKEGLSVDFLSYSMEVSKDNASLREGHHAIERFL